MATVLTDDGKAIIAGRIKGTGTEPNYIAIGTGTTAADAADAALETEVETRANGTSSVVTTTVTNDTYRTTGTITATGARAVTEAGTLDASSSGNLAIRSVFSVINLSTDDTITITADLVIS